jgi:hypothetical protein
MKSLPGLLVLTSALVGVPKPCSAADASIAGNWVVTVLFPHEELSRWVVQIEEKDGKQTASLLSAVAPVWEQGAKLTAFTRQNMAIHFTIQFGNADNVFVVYVPEKVAVPSRLLGSMEIRRDLRDPMARRGHRAFARLERTDQSELDPQKHRVIRASSRELSSARRLKDAKKRLAALKQVVDKYPGEVAAYQAGLYLVQVLTADGAGETEIRGPSEKVIKFASDYGPEMKLGALDLVAAQLVGTDKLAGLALGARQAEKMLDASTPPAQQVGVLKTLATALRKSNKTDESAQVEARLSKLNELLDAKTRKK